jgi:hypothetical protein
MRLHLSFVYASCGAIRFHQTRTDSYLFVFFFGQSTGKAGKFMFIINVLDVLRESPILVPGWFNNGI